MIFEGKYLNKKGKECYNKEPQVLKLKFEGYYKNGKKWDQIGYDIEHFKKLELKNGKGYGKEYDANDRFIFEGEYIKGERNEKGKEYVSDYWKDKLNI